MDERTAITLATLKRRFPEVAASLTDHFKELRTDARDRMENATTDEDRTTAAIQARTYRDLLFIFDDAQTIVTAKEQREHPDKRGGAAGQLPPGGSIY